MSASGTVLVVDDSGEQLADVEAPLAEMGYRVATVRDGDAAAAATTTELPVCVLVNTSPPNHDGIAACDRIRATPRGDDIALIIIAAQPDVATFDRALAAAGDDVITRPFDPTELIDRVRTAVEWRRHARNRTELDTRLKRQRDRLQRLELGRQQLIEFFVHDLKAPVNATDLHAQLIARCVDDRAAVLAYAKRIRAEARGLAVMLVNLLDLSRADEAQLKPVPSEIDAVSLLHDVLAELAVVASSSGVTIATELRTATIRADRGLLVRVLGNLVDNAIRHSPRHGQVRVEIAGGDQCSEIRVSDQGPGIPAEHRTDIFERFTTAGHTTRWNRGLGLAFCKVAVEAHGGEIWIEDGSPGAVFCVRI